MCPGNVYSVVYQSSALPISKRRNSLHNRPLKVLNVNCQSVGPKKGEFQKLIDSTSTDTGIATVTWLKEGKHHFGEIREVHNFSSCYKLYRKDREDGYGGMFVGVARELASSRAEELETEAESVWVSISLTGNKILLVSGFYRPHENDETRLDQFKSSVARLASYPNAHIWIAGNLNFPGIDWVSKYLKPTWRYPSLHQPRLY